jgi:hypothetical protein
VLWSDRLYRPILEQVIVVVLVGVVALMIIDAGRLCQVLSWYWFMLKVRRIITNGAHITDMHLNCVI